MTVAPPDTSWTPDARWTIDELSAQVARALARGYEAPANGQVRAVPDRRTIRYYTTLGLVDPPAGMRGRTALYGRRHLLQLVAIKRLQAAGLPLQQVQQELAAADDARLERTAGLTLRSDAAPSGAASAAPTARRRREQAFWSAPPAPPARPAPAVAGSTADEAQPLALHGVALPAGLSVLWRSYRAPTEQDCDAIVEAAAPLLRVLRSRGLIAPPQDRKEGTR